MRNHSISTTLDAWALGSEPVDFVARHFRVISMMISCFPWTVCNLILFLVAQGKSIKIKEMSTKSCLTKRPTPHSSGGNKSLFKLIRMERFHLFLIITWFDFVRLLPVCPSEESNRRKTLCNRCKRNRFGVKDADWSRSKDGYRKASFHESTRSATIETSDM